MHLQFYITIPRRVTILCDNRISFNENKDVFKDLNEVPSSYDWFLYEYIDAEVNKKFEKPKDDLHAIKWKRRLKITWIVSITIQTG